MFGQPVLVLEGSKETLVSAHTRAVRRGLAMAIFTVDLFRTGNDTDNRAAVRTVHCGDLDLVGLAMHGPRNPVDKISQGRPHAPLSRLANPAATRICKACFLNPSRGPESSA